MHRAFTVGDHVKLIRGQRGTVTGIEGGRIVIVRLVTGHTVKAMPDLVTLIEGTHDFDPTVPAKEDPFWVGKKN